MRYASWFGGICGFNLALDAAGHQCVFDCEIDDFCETVRVARYGRGFHARDITKVRAQDIPDADLWVAGFPCQDLSVAGKRGGIRANRSGLVWRLLDLAEQLGPVRRPDGLWLENVPGLLNSNRGGDFGLLVRRLQELGYVGCYRTTDAQFFGVPQRRRRVFIVARLGAACPLEVLFEPQGGGGNPPARGQAGAGPAAQAAGGPGVAGGAAASRKIAQGQLARAVGGVGGGQDFGANKGTLVPGSPEVANALTQNESEQSYRGDGSDNIVPEGEKEVAATVTPDVGGKSKGWAPITEADNLVADPLTASYAKHGGSHGGKESVPHNLVQQTPSAEIAHTVAKSSGGAIGGRDCQDDYVIQEKVGAISPGAHPGGHNGQDDDKVICIQDVRGSGRDDVNSMGKVASKGSDRDTGIGVRQDDKSYTLGAVERHGVAVPADPAQAFETRIARNGRGAPDSVVPPLKAQSGRSGKGDGAPCVMAPGEAVAFDAHNKPKDKTGTLVGGHRAGGRNELNSPLVAQDVAQGDVVHRPDVAPTVEERYSRTGNERTEADRLIVLQDEGAVPIHADAARAGGGAAKTPSADAEGSVRLRDPGLGVGKPGDPAFTVMAAGPHAVAVPDDGQGLLFDVGGRPPAARADDGGDHAVAINMRAATRDADRDPENRQSVGVSKPGAPMGALQTDGGVPAVAYGLSNQPTPKVGNGLMPTLDAKAGKDGQRGGTMDVVAMDPTSSTVDPGNVSPTLRTGSGGASGHHSGVAAAQEGAPMMVRRLTPTECERLQGFPDGWTCTCGVNPDCKDRRIPPWVDQRTFKLGGCGHSICGCRCSDSSRYKALGNAVAVANVRWIADRIQPRANEEVA